jgi:hypothetical protein
MLQKSVQQQNVNLVDFEAHGRPFSEDAIERDMFVAYSQTNGNLETHALPEMSESGHAFAAVKWPTEKKAAAAKQATAKAIEANAAALAPKVKMARVPSLFNGDFGVSPDAKLRWIDPTDSGSAAKWSPLVVMKVSAATVELETKADRMFPYGCKDTNQLDTTGSGRTFVQDCKYKHEIVKHTLSVTFAELPDGIELKKGDVVTLWGDLESSKETKTAVRRVITARGLGSVKRGADVVWPQ